jgi:hypothetical protein
MTQEQPASPSASASAAPSPDDRSTDFHAAQGEPQQYSGETLLVSAYGMLWVVIMVWLAIGWRKQSRLTQRLDDLERAIDKAADEQPSKKA